MLEPRARIGRETSLDQGAGLASSDRQNRPAGLGPGFFARDAVTVAQDLVGVTLLLDGVGGTIVETEAYTGDDPASHSFKGRTARNASMFGPPGRAYVYRSYGLHWCLNVVCGGDPAGSAVLVRALEPVQGLDVMRERRGVDDVRLLCSGPGRLSQALGVTGRHDGAPLDRPPFQLRGRQAAVAVGAATRIGITRAAERPWRFAMVGSRFLSRGLPR
jgi:DNA-3-methyladenine glycosylase